MPTKHASASTTEIVRLTGSLDASATQKVREELDGLCQSDRPKIIIDLEKVQFIDSSGLSVLVATLKKARNKGGDVVLINLSSSVRSIIELTRLHRILEICDSEQAALDRLAS